MSEAPSGQPESSGPADPPPPADQSGATAVGGGHPAPPTPGPYAAPPAPGQYGNPPYGAPQYGAPQGPGQYGAPQGPGQYGAPQYGAPQGPGQYGAPQYGGPVPPPGYAPGGPGGPGGGAPKKSHTKLVIALIAAVVLIAAVLVGVFALAGGGAKPQDAVTTYLQDLAKGDAAGALKQGALPASTKLLTDDTLKQQQAIAKISNIKVVSEQVVGSRAQVHVTYGFGAKNADSTYSLTKTGDGWKITQTAYPIDVSDIRDIPQLTLFGTDISNDSKVYVFPGPLKWGSGSEYFAVTDDKSADFSTGPDDTSGLLVTLKADLSDAGKSAIADAVGKFIGTCAASTSLAPDGCPQQEFDSYGVDGTAKWTAPADLSTVRYDTFGDPATTVDVSGDLTWSVTYQAKDFDGNVTTETDDDVSGYVSGKVDLTQSPPTFTADS